jgi:hypothetical protein
MIYFATMASISRQLTYLEVLGGFKDRLGLAVEETPLTVFVCGPNVKKLSNGGGRSRGAAIRNFVSHELGRNRHIYVWGEHKRFRMDSAQRIGRYFSDAEREVMFAVDVAVDLVLIFPASAGSLAELGAFALQDDIAKKMLIIFDKEHRRSKGFVVGGLVKSAKKRNAVVRFRDYRNRWAIWDVVHDRIRTIQSLKVKNTYGKKA